MADSGNAKKPKKEKDESWDFKIDDEHLEQVKMKKATVQASGGQGIPAPTELKKVKPKRKLSVEGPRKEKRMTRAAIARRDMALQSHAELMSPGIISRAMATLIDYFILGVIGGSLWFFYEKIRYYYIEFLADKGINQTLPPETLKLVLLVPPFILLGFIFVYYPAMAFKKTPGKRMMKIRIGHPTIGEKPSSFMILLRELILKPISLVSVIGVLIGLKNDGSRCLHDIICQTALYIDD